VLSTRAQSAKKINASAKLSEMLTYTSGLILASAFCGDHEFANQKFPNARLRIHNGFAARLMNVNPQPLTELWKPFSTGILRQSL
jgi:hypothetical protein